MDTRQGLVKGLGTLSWRLLAEGHAYRLVCRKRGALIAQWFQAYHLGPRLSEVVELSDLQRGGVSDHSLLQVR